MEWNKKKIRIAIKCLKGDKALRETKTRNLTWCSLLSHKQVVKIRWILNIRKTPETKGGNSHPTTPRIHSQTQCRRVKAYNTTSMKSLLLKDWIRARSINQMPSVKMPESRVSYHRRVHHILKTNTMRKLTRRISLVLSLCHRSTTAPNQPKGSHQMLHSRLIIWVLKIWVNTKKVKISSQRWLLLQTLNQGLQRRFKLWVIIEWWILKAKTSVSKVWPLMTKSLESKMPGTTRRTWSRRTLKGYKRLKIRETNKQELTSYNVRKPGKSKKSWRISFYKRPSNTERRKRNRNKMSKKIILMFKLSWKGKRKRNNNRSLWNQTRRKGRNKCWSCVATIETGTLLSSNIC